MAGESANPSLNFRQPSNITPSPDHPAFELPPLSFLSGNWNVTHSTLPMWKSNRNVVISYSPIDTVSSTSTKPDISASLSTTSIDDLVTYQPLSSDKLKTVKGVDTPHPNIKGGYNWRGKGWLKIASSQWEVIGWGEEDGGWVVTLFQKTLFTPMGIDIYARRKGGLSEDLLEKIKGEMANIGNESFTKLVKDIFQIKHDWKD